MFADVSYLDLNVAFIYTSIYIEVCLFVFLRKGISSSKLESLLKFLDESVTSCQERDSFLQTVQMKLDRVTGSSFDLPSGFLN